MGETNPSEQASAEEPIGEEEGEFSGAESLAGQDVLADEDLPEAQAHCPHCLEPITSADYYCPKCMKPVGQLTGILPLINAPFQAQFIGDMWRRLWHKDRGWALRVLCAIILATLLYLTYWPFLCVVIGIGVVFVLWQRISTGLSRRRERRK